MKRIAFLAVMMAWAISASATSVLYFTRSQAERAVSYLNRQNELMIYCGYEYEIETYVLLNEVWAERVNSAYYELWIYGWDAYTGEEIYMPIDLQCIWLYSAGRMYNAAQYLRFRTSSTLHRPTMTWTVPAYNHYTRVMHRPGYVRTYHYDVHRHGWMPPAPHHSGPAAHPMHPYYMRAPHTPAPHTHGSWTPGVDRPQVETPHQSGSSSGVRPSPTQSGTATSPTTGANPSRSNSAATPTRSGNKTEESATPTRSGSNTSTTPSRSSNTTTTPSRSNTPAATPSRSNKSDETATPTRSNSSNTTPSRSSGKNTTTTTPSRSSATSTPSRSSEKNTTTTPSRSGNANTAAPSRNNSTPAATPTRSGSATPTRR